MTREISAWPGMWHDMKRSRNGFVRQAVGSSEPPGGLAFPNLGHWLQAVAIIYFDKSRGQRLRPHLDFTSRGPVV